MGLQVDHGERGMVAARRPATGFLTSDCDNRWMRISAKADYAVRAALELAASPEGEPVKGEQLADAQDIPLQFLEHILLNWQAPRG